MFDRLELSERKRKRKKKREREREAQDDTESKQNEIIYGRGMLFLFIITGKVCSRNEGRRYLERLKPTLTNSSY